ncbi:hypothetical protein QE435_002405 [Rhizobium sp. SORGH_AS 787]|nr:hypothetical protein [Rhizobium sp. SORGH_AS_0787]
MPGRAEGGERQIQNVKGVASIIPTAGHHSASDGASLTQTDYTHPHHHHTRSPGYDYTAHPPAP